MTHVTHGLQVGTELFRVLVETMADAMAVVSPDGRIQYSSPAIEPLTGHLPAERVGQHLLDIVHPDDVVRLAAVIERTRLDRQPFEHLEYRIKHADGTWRFVESRGRSMQPSDPDALWVIVSHDVTHRHAATQALRDSEERYQALVRHAAIGIFHSTKDGRFLDANPALVRMLGYHSVDDVLALNMAADVWTDSASRDVLLPDESGAPKEVEVQWKRRDGTSITVHLQGRALGGSPTVYETFAEDVTQRRIIEAQFRQSYKLEAIGRLAGSIAHDFNNLLSSILGFSELLIDQMPATDPRLEDVKEIRKSAERAAGLTRQLLTYSRKQVARPQRVDVNSVVTGLDDLLRRIIGKDIEMRLRLEPDLPEITADPTQIEQVVTNLVTNSHEAMPDGGKLVIETARCTVDAALAEVQPSVLPGQYVMLAVSDTGIGMDAEIRAKLFEPFFSTKKRGTGAGLGLATVYGIVRQTGGAVWVYSQPGMGSTFKIYLPVASGAAVVMPASNVGIPRDGTETILVVDDDEAVRELAGRVLRRFGYQVLMAQSATEAESVFAQNVEQIQLVLTDVMMPQTSGIELANKLARLKPALAVVYMSGYPEDAFSNRSPQDPKVTLVSKPFTPESLATRVRQALDRD